MEIKKSQKADLEGKKSTSMLIGYVIVLAAIFVAFEWTQREKKVVEVEPVFSAAIEEDMIPISKQPEVMAPPPAAARSEERRVGKECRSRTWPDN